MQCRWLKCCVHCLDSEDVVDIMYYAIGSDLASQPQKSSVYLASRHGDTSNCACGKSDQCRASKCIVYTSLYPIKVSWKQYKCILFSELVIYLFREKVESLVRRRKSRILCVDVIPLAFVTYTWFQKHCC